MARKRHHSSKKKHHSAYMGHMHEHKGMKEAMSHHLGSSKMHAGPNPHHHSPYPAGSEEAKEKKEYGISEKGGNQASYRRHKMMGGFYEGPEPRRQLEKSDGSMIHEDHNAIANLPQNVMIKAYPDRMNYLPEDLDDTMHGIDRQIDYDDGKRSDNFYPKKV
jgi:hypothetical protein